MNLDERLLRQARTARTGLTLTIGLGFVGGVVVVLQARYIARIIDGAFLKHEALAELQPLLILVVAFVLLRAVLSWGSEIAANGVANRVKQTLRERLLAHILALGPAYAHGERTGELTNTVVEGVEALERLAAAELRVALDRLADRLDPGAPLLVFADHGFRLDPKGDRFVHGGPSVLERTVPVLRFESGR